MKLQKSIFIFTFFTILLCGCANPNNTGNQNSQTNQTSTTKPDEPYTRPDCSIYLPSTVNLKVNIDNAINNINTHNCYESDSYKVIIEANPANINIENATYDAREQMIHLFSYTEGIIGITLYNETANVKSNICMVTFGSTNTGNDNNDDNNLGNNEDDNNNDNNNDGEDVSENINAMFIGTWYCSKGSLMAYLEFYSDGTGKAYMNDSNNYSSFRWSINNNILTFEGNVRNTTAFTITEDTLYLDSLCGLNNLTYTKQ